MYSLDVLGGIQYSLEIWAETVKPGPRLTGTKQVPEYSKYLFFSSLLLLHCGPLCLLMMCEYNEQKEIIMGTNAVADLDLEVRAGGRFEKPKLRKKSIKLPQPCGPQLLSKNKGGGLPPPGSFPGCMAHVVGKLPCGS